MEQKNDTLIHTVTPATMADFLSFESGNGVSANMIRRLSCAIRLLYDYLTEDKVVTRDVLLGWRKSMEEHGYASQTVQNYVKYVNRYIDFVGCSDMRFNRGKGKDISGMVFGFLTAVEPTEKRDRKDVVWLCRCKCGNTVELAATRLIQSNTLSCGCLQEELIKRTNKYFGGTSLEKSLKDTVTSTRSMSGYVGVTRKREKWQAYITYQGKRISLGTYTKLEDAVKARAKGKEAVMEDASKLLQIYEEIHQSDEALPSKFTVPKTDVPRETKVINDQPTTAARRRDNTSGHTGITFYKNKWEARICYRKVRYMLGYFSTLEEAVCARRSAEEMLKIDAEAFVEYYSKHCRQHDV